MLNPSQFRDLVSGRRRGAWAATLRCGLRLAELPYTWAVCWRNRRYDTGAAETRRVGVPVVSVGNLTLGGTGKTPMVEWLARWFRRRDVRVTVISRGYGQKGVRNLLPERPTGGCAQKVPDTFFQNAFFQNDEALELQQKLPDVPHLQDPDRVAAAKRAVEGLQCQLILLDDAFQHRRIARDLDIVLLDALEPFGFGHVFPRGTLREPLVGLRRADVVALSRADMLEPPERAEIWWTVRRHAPQAARLELTHAARALISSSGQEQPLGSLEDHSVAAFCGIGNPAGFRHTLETCGYRLADFREFSDHHPYDRADVESLTTWADGLDVAAVLCTHKDLVKLGIDQLGRRPLRAISIGLELLTGQDALEAKLVPLVALVPR